MSAVLRTAGSVICLSSWMVLLFSGIILGGAVHLLLAASLALYPWRALRGRGD